MPATKVNYLVLYIGESQVYGTAQKETALSSPPPNDSSVKDKRILYIAFEPDSQNLVVYPIPQEEVEAAELLEPKPKKEKKVDVEEI